MQVVVVGQKAWRPHLEAAFVALEPRQEQMAAAVLRYMHDLHLGLTPELAAGLVRSMSTGFLSPSRQELARARDVETRIWAAIFERLESRFVAEEPDEAPEAAVRHPEKRRRHTGLVPGAAPFYYVARLAVPLVARAVEQVGRSFLFATEDEPVPASFPQQYLRYSIELNRELRALAEEPRVSEVFWTDRALTLNRLSRRGDETPGIPDVDAVALAPLLRLDPDLETKSSPYRSIPPRMTASPRFRPWVHRNEGGVDGIHRTRRLADLSGILKSELIHPRPLLLDRVLQSGYLALRRPPLREKQRHMLLAGILPGLRAPDSMARALLKATWFDAMVRLSVRLRKSGLQRSEFRWIEADPWGRQRASRCLLEDMPDLGRTLPDAPGRVYRREFLAGLGWLPGYLDRHEAGRWPVGRPDRRDAARWAVSAWRGQRDHPRWLTKGERHGGHVRRTPLDAGAYGTVHVMLFLPRDPRGDSSAGSLLHELGLPLEPGYSAGITWVPADVTDMSEETGWAVTGFCRSRRRLFDATELENGAGADLENRLAGALLDVWLDMILRELFRDD